MEVIKKGYQQTEIGIIPKDWKVVELGEKFQFKNGLNKAKEFFGYGTPIVNYMDVFNNVGLYKDFIHGKVFLTNDEIRNYNVKLGDVLFTRTSETPEEIGMSSVLLENIPKAVFSGFVLRARAKDETIDNEYKKYCFRSNQIRQQIISTASYTTRALTNGRLLSVVKIPLPPLPEQKAIAEVLSDMDNLITALERQIEKKRLVKQGAMQRLLTAGEDWEVVELGDAIEFLDNVRKPIKSSDRLAMQGIYPYYGASGIIDYVNDYLFDDELILLGEDGDNILSRSSPLAFKVKGKIWVNNHAHVLKPKDDFHIDFLTPYLESLDYKLLNTGTAQPKLNKQVCSKIKVLKPPLFEQTHIAIILSDMDGAIAGLEKQLEKYRGVKVGLMQELLSGRKRLIDN
jgi:type I restriction enzyme S subunit